MALRILATLMCCIRFVAEAIFGGWRRAPSGEDLDRPSLKLILAATFFGTFGAIFIGYAKFGRIEMGSNFVQPLGVLLLLGWIAIRLASIFTLKSISR